MGSRSEAEYESLFESCYAISSSISNICDVGEEGADKVIDRNFSIVPKYLAFLRSNSGQEKLEKESLRLL